MNDMENSTFEIEYLEGKVLAFGISKRTQKSVIEIIGEKLKRLDGAIVYVLDDFSFKKDVIKSSGEDISEDEVVDFTYDFFVHFIERTQQEGEHQIVFNIKMDKTISVELYQRVLDRLHDDYYIDEGRINPSDNCVTLICK